MFGSLPIPELIAKARTLYTNAQFDEDIAGPLTTDFGYTPQDFTDGLALVDALAKRDADQRREYGEQYTATEAVQTATSDLRALYTAHRRLGRAAHRPGTAPYAALGPQGDTPDDRESLIRDADTFYRNLETDPTLASGVRGLTPAAVAAGRAAVEAARAATDTQARETGDAQRATATRDDAAHALRLHASEMAEVARIALADQPQLRERIGLLER